VPKPSKRDQLVEATKEILWEVGYEAMSPRDIQARSAAKPGSLYHHFPSKLAIAEVALGEVAAEEIARLEEVKIRGLTIVCYPHKADVPRRRPVCPLLGNSGQTRSRGFARIGRE
jgi:AcrR family transcriptional regulator